MGDIFCWFKISQEFCLRCCFWNRDVGWNVVPCNESFFCSHRTGGGNGSCYVVNWRWNSLDLGNFKELFKTLLSGEPESHMEKKIEHMIEFRGISSCQLLGCGLSAPWPWRGAVVTETQRIRDGLCAKEISRLGRVQTPLWEVGMPACDSQGLKHEPAAKDSLSLYIDNQIKSISFFAPLLRQRITNRCVAVDHHLVFLNIHAGACLISGTVVLADFAASFQRGGGRWGKTRPFSKGRWPWTRDAGEGIQRCPG